MQRLLVIQADNLDTSACIISPQQAKYDYYYFFFVGVYFIWAFVLILVLMLFSFDLCSFVINGRGVEKRNNTSMVCIFQLSLDYQAKMTPFDFDGPN